MRTQLQGQLRHLKPHMLDPWAFVTIAVAFGIGVMLLAWHGTTLRFEVEGANLSWIVLVGFGMTWHGEWAAGWRVGAGLVLGAAASMAAFYGSLSLLPITPFSFGLAMGVTATIIALLAHMYPRALSFAGAAVGFAVGVSAARALPVRVFTPADDLFALMLTVSLCLVLGVTGSLALRAIVLRMGRERGTSHPMHLRSMPRLLHREDRSTHPKPRQKTGASR